MIIRTDFFFCWGLLWPRSIERRTKIDSLESQKQKIVLNFIIALRELRYFSVAFGELRRRRAIRNNTTKLRVGGYGGAAERGDIPK